MTRLEDMLAQEKKKVRQLMESLDQLGATTINVKRSPPKVCFFIMEKKYLDLVGLVTSWVSSNNHSSFL